MTTALATNGASRIEGLEKAFIGGDLSDLTEQQRLALYNAKCKAAGLDPLSQPFAYIVLKGKLTLYALKTASDQLIAIHRLSVEITRRGYDRDFPGVYISECTVTFPHAQKVSNIGAVWINDRLFGDDLCNAIMKAVTKSVRRTVLSACGLGMLDESELETIPGSDVPLSVDRVIIERPPGPAIVHEPTGEPRSEVISEPKAWLRRTIQIANDNVRNHLLIEGVQGEFKGLANEFQVIQALITSWIGSQHIDEAELLKPNGKRDPAKVGAAFQVAWHQDTDEVKGQIRAYLVDKTKQALREHGLEMPEDLLIVPCDDDSSQATAADD